MSKTDVLTSKRVQVGDMRRKYIVFGVIFSICARFVAKNCNTQSSVFESGAIISKKLHPKSINCQQFKQ
jgi:hypothetical protein